MQIRLNTDVTLTNENEGTYTIPKGVYIRDVVSVSACPRNPYLRSIQIEYANGLVSEGEPAHIYQYILLPGNAFSIEEAPGWQAQARRIEERSAKALAA
jgi:hypothetical protein